MSKGKFNYEAWSYATGLDSILEKLPSSDLEKVKETLNKKWEDGSPLPTNKDEFEAFYDLVVLPTPSIGELHLSDLLSVDKQGNSSATYYFLWVNGSNDKESRINFHRFIRSLLSHTKVVDLLGKIGMPTLVPDEEQKYNFAISDGIDTIIPPASKVMIALKGDKFKISLIK